jgi:hypothetical protein
MARGHGNTVDGSGWMFAAAGPWLFSLLVFFALPLAGLFALPLTDQARAVFTANYATIADLSSGRIDVLIKTIRIGITAAASHSPGRTGRPFSRKRSCNHLGSSR